MTLILTIFVLLNQMQYNVQSLKNSRHGSHFGNECGGFCIATIQHPSPGFIIMEIWKDIEGYEGSYQVSNYGRVKSLNRLVIRKDGVLLTYRGRILRSRKSSSGYYNGLLCKKGNQTNYQISRLVAKAFISNSENKSEVNHKDGIKTNNFATNLEWCTRSENQHHAYLIGLRNYKRENHPELKLNEFQVRVIRKCNNLTQKELGRIFNVSQVQISTIKLNKGWKHMKSLNRQ